MAYAQMRTPFCDSASHRGALVRVATRSHFGSDVINVIHYRNAAALPLVPVPKERKNNRAWKRGMLLGVKFVKTVPLRHRLKLTFPRDADTAVNLFLVICSVPAVCELPVSLREREFVPSDCDIKINTIREGWCSFLWRRKRDSPPVPFGQTVFKF